MTKGRLRSLVLCICLTPAFAPAVTAEEHVAQELKTETGRLPELIARLASREYVLGSPAHDARPYVDPAPALHAFRHLAAAMAWGDVTAAAKQAAALDYELVEFTDADTNREFYVLREDLAAAKQLRGWGSYIFNPHSRVDAVIEVPHPMADVHTPEIGGRIFAACGARGLLIAGTHREKADVPDLVDSVFHQVHTAWIGPQAQVAAYQIHGFTSVKHAFPKATHVVVSTGDGAVPAAIADLDATLEEHGLASYVFNDLSPKANRRLNGDVPGVTFKSLAAAKNEQGRLSRSLGGSFVHVELEGDIRSNAQTRTLAGEAIAAVITGNAAAHGQPRNDEAVAVAVAQVASVSQPVGVDRNADSAPAELRIAAKPASASGKAILAADSQAQELSR